MRAWLLIAAVMGLWWSQPASATQSFCFREPSGWWNPMMTALPAVTNRIRLTRGGTFWNGVRVTPAELRRQLRDVRAMPLPGFTLLEYEMWVGCRAIDRLRDTVSSSLACGGELCGELIVTGYYRAPRRRSARSESAVMRQAERDIERAVRQAERALDALEREAEERSPSDDPDQREMAQDLGRLRAIGDAPGSYVKAR